MEQLVMLVFVVARLAMPIALTAWLSSRLRAWDLQRDA